MPNRRIAAVLMVAAAPVLVACERPISRAVAHAAPSTSASAIAPRPPPRHRYPSAPAQHEPWIEDRDFSEVDLRSMLERAKSHHPNHVEGRYVIETVHRGRAWEVGVEPDSEDRLLVVVTCYATDADR
jgi:hypothetical protein